MPCCSYFFQNLSLNVPSKIAVDKENECINCYLIKDFTKLRSRCSNGLISKKGRCTKMKFSIKSFFKKCGPNLQETVDLLAFIEKIFDGKLQLLCSEGNVNALEASNRKLSLPKFPNKNFLHSMSNNYQKTCYWMKRRRKKVVTWDNFPKSY